jgi:asparagine synthase (glutamine-hydrolysing)
VWDGERRRLVLARDRFGIKPLYYRDVPGDFAFASELKALRRHPGLSREVDLDALDAFLAFNAIHGPRTIYRDVRKLPPGHVLVREGGVARIERYADERPALAHRDEPWEALADELRERLRDSVHAHLVSDVPVGVLLSGGVDSSALAALAAEHGRVATFSIGFAEKSFSELELARTIARRYGTDHHELVVEPDAAELLPTIAAAFDEPFADSSALPTYLVSQLAAQHVKVALSGEGGDELFGGYETYVADALAMRTGGAARLLSPLAEALPSGSGRVPLDYKLKRFTRAAHLPPLERHHGWKEIFSPDARAELLRPDRRGTLDPLDVYRARWAETEGADTLARLQDVDRAIYLVDDLLVKTDRMSMAHSLELRVPFLDPVVAELALALPPAARVRGFAKKRLLRSAVEPLVGREIARGRKKGFSIPAAAWLRGELEPFAREVLSADRLRRQGYFEPAAVSRLIDEHVDRREDHSRQLWGLLSFSLWLDAA